MKVSRHLLACLIVLSFLPIPSRAQTRPNANAESTERLTNSLLELAGRYDRAASDAQPELLNQMRAVAAQRQQALAELLQDDPGQALRLALPSDVTLPADVRGLVEKHVSLEGVLEVQVEDGLKESFLHYSLWVQNKRIALHFSDTPPGHLLTGMPATVKGVEVGEALATSSSSVTIQTSAASSTSVLPNTFGAQKTLVILVNFQDNTAEPYTLQTASDVVFNQASSFWMENSFQQTWITGDVAGWFALPITAGTTCPTSSIETYAQQAAQNAGYVLSNYNHFLYFFPQLTACGWSGYSNIGGTPSNSWVNGVLNQSVVSHELGHALGLYHSHSLSCGGSVYLSSGCTQYEYGDYYETMGNSNVNGDSMHYNAYQKERLGWLNNGVQPPMTMVSSSGTYTIAPYETQDSNSKALKILQSSNSSGNAYYYVEARQAFGFDSILSYPVPGYGFALPVPATQTAATCLTWPRPQAGAPQWRSTWAKVIRTPRRVLLSPQLQ